MKQECPLVAWKGGGNYALCTLNRFSMVLQKVTNCQVAITMEKRSKCQQYHKELHNIISKPLDFTPAERMDLVGGLVQNLKLQFRQEHAT